MDELTKYEAICESYQELPLSSLQVLRDILETEISARIEGFCGGVSNKGVGDVEGVKAIDCYENNEQKSTIKPKLSLVRSV